MKTNLLILIVLLFFSIASSAQKTKVDLLIKAATVIDIETGKIRPHQAIAIRNDTIVKVFHEKFVNLYDAKQVVDASGKYMMPGLWDMHVHFGGGEALITENKNLLPLYLAHGITTVRDASADISQDVLLWREEIAKGNLQGPTIFTSGPKLEGYKSVWLGDLEISTSAELHKALDSLQGLKVDFVKITDNTLKPELYLEAIREVKKRGLQISGHVPYAFTLNQVVDAGLSSVEHLSYVWKAGAKNEQEISEKIAKGELKGSAIHKQIMDNFDKATALKAYRNMAKHGTAVTPTLSLPYNLAYLDQNDHKDDAYLQYIGKGLQKTYEGRVKRALQDSKEAIALRHEVFEKSSSILPLLQQAGVMMMAGTDAGYLNSYAYPGIGLHQELELMVKYGLTPLQALQASVINSPKFLNKNNYGSIAAGKKADILLLEKNPLNNISATQSIFAVVAKGKLLTRKTLDEMLEEVKRQVAGTQ